MLRRAARRWAARARMGSGRRFKSDERLTSRLKLRYLRSVPLVADPEPEAVEVRRVRVAGNLDEPELLAARRRRRRERRLVHHGFDPGRYVFLAGFEQSRATHRVRPGALGVCGARPACARSPGGGGGADVCCRALTGNDAVKRFINFERVSRCVDAGGQSTDLARVRRTRFVRNDDGAFRIDPHGCAHVARLVPAGDARARGRRARVLDARGSGGILRLAQVLPRRGDAGRVRRVQAEYARVRLHGAGRHRRD